MRPVYLFFLFFIIVDVAFAQSTDTSIKKYAIPGPSANVIIRCRATALNDQPLWIVDGVIADSAGIRKIDPGDIATIDILRSSAATAVYGCLAAKGVIIITTKIPAMKRFAVVDALDASVLPASTVTFISLQNKKDSLQFVADDEGKVQTKNLKAGEKYKVTISSAGYKTKITEYEAVSFPITERYFLARDVKENQAVTVVGYPLRKVWCRMGCGGVVITRTDPDSTTHRSEGLSLQVYPNPLVRGMAVKLDINMLNEDPLQFRITNINGTVLRSIAYRSFKGLNRVEVSTASQWAAGMYFIQVLNAKGKLLKQDKFLIQ